MLVSGRVICWKILESLAVKNGILSLPLKNNFTAPAKMFRKSRASSRILFVVFLSQINKNGSINHSSFFLHPKKRWKPANLPQNCWGGYALGTPSTPNPSNPGAVVRHVRCWSRNSNVLTAWWLTGGRPHNDVPLFWGDGRFCGTTNWNFKEWIPKNLGSFEV